MKKWFRYFVLLTFRSCVMKKINVEIYLEILFAND